MKKYKLIDEARPFGLYRIQALIDIPGVVRAGEKGGLIEKASNLSQEGGAWVSYDAKVSGNARVSDDARVFDNAKVFGGAKVFGNARVSGNARVFGGAEVYGGAKVSKPHHVFTASALGYHVTVTPQNIVVGCQTWAYDDALPTLAKALELGVKNQTQYRLLVATVELGKVTVKQ